MRINNCHPERSEGSALGKSDKQIPRRFAPRNDILVCLLTVLAFSSAEAQRRKTPTRPRARAVVPAPKPTGTPRFEWFEYRGRDSAYLKLKVKPDEYVNPILAGFYPDPSIERVGDDYYLVTSSFAYFPGVPIFHSKNLVDWTQIGSVLDRPSQLNLDSAGISRGIFAPVIRYNAGKFYMITTLIDRGGNFIVTATNPAGPWSDPVWLKQIDGIDPSLFFDDDGKAYIVNNGPPIGQPLYNGHRAIWIQQFDTRTMTLVGSRDVIVNGGVDLAKHPIWIEAPHILKVNGKYYLICAEGGTADQHSEVVFRSDDVRGPYVPFSGNPILTQRHLDLRRPLPITTTGHADFVQTPAGEWWTVFLGVRPYEARRNLYNNGRETYLLPVRWVDGWPRILDGNATVPYVQTRPSIPSEVATLQGDARAASALPTAGNFVIRDEFDDQTLAPYWNLIRTPRSQWYDLTSMRGALTIQPRAEDIGGKGQPSFIGRRQQHIIATASTSMLYAPEKPGDRAGLAAFHNEDHYYLLTVTRVGARTEVQLERRSGPAAGTKPALIASAPLASIRRPVQLQIRAKGGRYDFLYATMPGKWKLLAGDLDGTMLSTPVAGGFVGTMFGMYAYSAP